MGPGNSAGIESTRCDGQGIKSNAFIGETTTLQCVTDAGSGTASTPHDVEFLLMLAGGQGAANVTVSADACADGGSVWDRCDPACPPAASPSGPCVADLIEGWDVADAGDPGLTALFDGGWPLRAGAPCAITRGAPLNMDHAPNDYAGTIRSNPTSIGADGQPSASCSP